MSKNLKPLLLVFLLLTFFSTQIKAQDDPACGWYVDGVKTDKIDCYSFGTLHLVLPYNSAWGSYHKLNVQIDFALEVMPIQGIQVFQGGSISSVVKGKYIVYTVFDKSWQAATNFNYNTNQTHKSLTRWMMGHKEIMMGKGGKPANDIPLFGKVYGLTITGYEEKFDEGCQCVKRQEVTTETKLSQSYPLICTNRSTSGKDSRYEATDLTQTCTVTGTKVDFNSLGKSTSNNSNTNSNSTKNTEVKTETSVKTTVTNNTSSNALTPSALKPLDKKKPGYFAEKDGDQISKEGYKKGDALNGEVRVYDEGKIREVTFYVNDQKSGPSTMYYENGKVEMTGNYKNDEKDGEWKMYNDSGKLKETKKYLNGEVQD